jgi:NADPH2:quinone reductase
MRAAWYERRGPARGVLVVGEMPDPHPGPGEVRIALSVSGISPGDVKKRAGWQGSPMPYPRVVPHSDGAGVIDETGPGVPASRIGEPAWCYGAQSYRPFGTAAGYVTVPAALAVPLPVPADPLTAADLAEQAACLGIAGITGYRAVFADGPVTGLSVLVHGAAGGVGSIAVQLARRGGARVGAVVRGQAQRERAGDLGAEAVFLADQPELAAAIREHFPDGMHRIAEVDLAAHIDLDAAVIAVGGTISSYFSSADRPPIPYWQLGFADATLRLLGSDDFPPAVKAEAAAALTAALGEGALRSVITARLPLDQIAAAHELIECGTPGRVVIQLADETGRGLSGTGCETAAGGRSRLEPSPRSGPAGRPRCRSLLPARSAQPGGQSSPASTERLASTSFSPTQGRPWWRPVRDAGPRRRSLGPAVSSADSTFRLAAPRHLT